MNRLQSELQRLFLPPQPTQRPLSEGLELVGPDGRVRAMVLELTRPAGWTELSGLWQGVQADLGLPAPAIAISGVDAYELWFSLAEPVLAERAVAFLEGLRRRYLGGVAPHCVRLHPAADAAAPVSGRHARVVPPAQVAPDRWSAFVAADLAALFADEPSLDHPPGIDAQADLLARIESAPPAAFTNALARLVAIEAPAATDTGAAAQPADPRHFLLSVMQDPSVDLRLRIEAAKALLPGADKER